MSFRVIIKSHAHIKERDRSWQFSGIVDKPLWRRVAYVTICVGAYEPYRDPSSSKRLTDLIEMRGASTLKPIELTDSHIALTTRNDTYISMW